MTAQLVKSDADYLSDVFKALSDPIRLDIMRRVLRTDELACTELEEVLPVTKSTISYHMKILFQAGLVAIRKSGRYYFYRSRREETSDLLPGLWDRIADLEPRQYD